MIETDLNIRKERAEKPGHDMEPEVLRKEFVFTFCIQIRVPAKFKPVIMQAYFAFFGAATAPIESMIFL
ncbi:MAG: hypothetical protein ABWY16_11090 [Pedobacter sp.]|uniref:hypothetical protein n=1 Tax=Pedobacter sp. TaxID=1411316 RepID=UPI0033965E94